MRDIDIRQNLKTIKLGEFLLDGASKVVDEFSFPSVKSRIDIAVINCSLHGYEIKSSCDTLQRLPSQLAGYSKVLDYLNIVTEEKHITHIERMIPDWVGLMVCEQQEEKVKFIDVKVSKKNPNKESFHIAKLLWREEIIDLLNEHEIRFRKKDRNWLLCEVLAANLELELVSNLVRNKLKFRAAWKL